MLLDPNKTKSIEASGGGRNAIFLNLHLEVLWFYEKTMQYSPKTLWCKKIAENYVEKLKITRYFPKTMWCEESIVNWSKQQ